MIICTLICGACATTTTDPPAVDGGGATSIADAADTLDQSTRSDIDTTTSDTGDTGTARTDISRSDAAASAPAGADVTTPFPIDRGDDPNTPGRYKGLDLRLTDTGQPSILPVDGTIGVICIGPSNGLQECEAWRKLRQSDAASVSPAVKIANCGASGAGIEAWIDSKNDAKTWQNCIDVVLPQQGIKADQVKVIWHKAAQKQTVDRNGQPLPLYPAATSALSAMQAKLDSFAQRVATHFKAVNAVYIASRSYGGYSQRVEFGEPVSYEQGHAINQWLKGNANRSGIWYGWGGYIWAPDCASGEKNASGVCYTRGDYANDGLHPASGAEQKIAETIHQRMLTQSWYRR